MSILVDLTTRTRTRPTAASSLTLMPPGEYIRLSTEDDRLPPFADDDGGQQGDKDDVKSPLRPHVYYDDGPFDAPSSESDDEDEKLKSPPVRSPGLAETGFADLSFRDPRVCP